MLTLPAVLDVNDETPTFFPATYNVSVSEDVPREFRVVWLNCTDDDAGLNAELSYFITGVPAAAPPLAWLTGGRPSLFSSPYWGNLPRFSLEGLLGRSPAPLHPHVKVIKP